MMDPVTNLRTPNNSFEASSDLHSPEGSDFPLQRAQASPFEIGNLSVVLITPIEESVTACPAHTRILSHALLDSPIRSHYITFTVTGEGSEEKGQLSCSRSH